VADEIRTRLADVGVEVEVVQAADVEDYFERVRAQDYDMALAGWIADTADNVDFLDSLLHSDSIPSAGKPVVKTSNIARWNDAETDRLLAQLRTGKVPDAQRAVLDRVADQVPLLPIAYGPSVTITSWRVQRFQPHPFSIYQVFAELDVED
jgi:ABC-type oligopeptide transport system substrate-binding subunit